MSRATQIARTERYQRAGITFSEIAREIDCWAKPVCSAKPCLPTVSMNADTVSMRTKLRIPRSLINARNAECTTQNE